MPEPMEIGRAFALVYELAETSALSPKEANTEGLVAERARQIEALNAVYAYITSNFKLV